MRPVTALLVLGLLSCKAYGQAPGPTPSQSLVYGSQQSAASPNGVPGSATQQMTSGCSTSSFQIATPLYAVGSSTGSDLENSLTGCIVHSSCQVSVSRTASCSITSSSQASVLAAPQQNCTAGQQPVYACKGFAVSPGLYQRVQSGSCTDDWQQQNVWCSGMQLQRNLYQAILSGIPSLLHASLPFPESCLSWATPGKRIADTQCLL